MKRLFVVIFVVAMTAAPASLTSAQQRAQQPVAPRSGPAPGTAPRNPFQLNAIEQAYLDQVLEKWELESSRIQTFSCPFTRYTFNAFSPNPQVHFSEGAGKLSYQKPDKGSFKIEKVRQWQATPVAPGQAPQVGQPPQGQHVDMPDVVGDHWVSDGKNIYEFRPAAKELAVTPIPPDMQGEEIVNGPFPFLFGAKANDLKQRYWMKVQPSNDQSVIVLLALPKTRMDAASYKSVDLMLDRRTLLPKVMRITQPSGERDVFEFDLAKASVNARVGRLWSALFQSPRTPWGWKRVVRDPGAQTATPQTPTRR